MVPRLTLGKRGTSCLNKFCSIFCLYFLHCRLSLVVSDFVQLDSISVRKSERRAGFLYKYLYIVLPSHVEVIYQDDILLPVAVTGDIDRKSRSRLPVFHICRHLDSRSKETPPSVFMLKIKSVLLYYV